jgi:hypothetical protein
METRVVRSIMKGNSYVVCNLTCGITLQSFSGISRMAIFVAAGTDYWSVHAQRLIFATGLQKNVSINVGGAALALLKSRACLAQCRLVARSWAAALGQAAVDWRCSVFLTDDLLSIPAF